MEPREAQLSLRGPVRNLLHCMGEVFLLKPFKTLDEQIQILKDRKLIIGNEDYAKNYLLSNGYYNVINGYSKYFPRSGDDYINGTTFEEVSRLCLFDKQLKQAMFEAILQAELHLKAIFSYHFSATFPNKPYAYLCTDCYNPTKVLSIIRTINLLSSRIEQQKKISTSSIRHYINNHNDVPIWVLVNQIDFGELRYMLHNSLLTIQNSVARDTCAFIQQNITTVSTFPPEVMMSFVDNINEVRNICAHNNRLLGYSCKSDSKYWHDLHSLYGIENHDNRRNVYSVFLSLQCFLSRTEYATLNNKFRKSMHILTNHLRSIDINTVLKELGFPDDWHVNNRRISL